MAERSGNRRGVKIAVIAVICAAAAFSLWWFVLRKSGGADSKEVAYVETVASLTGQGGEAGLINRYAGVVEAQESWSIEQNSDAVVKEMLVKVGDSVKKGDKLFTYDVDKYQTDLDQAEIDLERQQNELETAKETITQLETEKKKAKSSDQGTYTIQIKEQELTVKQTELDIESKKLEIEKLKNNIKHATVTSEIDGVVKTINNGDTDEDSYGETDNNLITIMRTGDLRVKGTINEQNVGSLTQGAELIVHSRTDPDQIWHGTIDKIDMENASSGQNNSYYGMDSGSGSTSYPFYVSLDTSDGLMIGQHVYLELDYGQSDEEEREGIWLYDYMIDMTDSSNPFVWADNNGKLEKRPVKLGGYDEDLMEYEIVSGITLEDSLAMPEERLTEGMITKPMSEMPADYGEEDGDEFEGAYDGGEEFSDDEEYLDDEEALDDDEDWEDDPDLDPDYEEEDGDWGTEEGFEGMDGFQGTDGMDAGVDGMEDVDEDPIDSLNAEEAER